MEASQHSLLAACFTLHNINATLAIVPQREAGLWIKPNLAPRMFSVILLRPYVSQYNVTYSCIACCEVEEMALRTVKPPKWQQYEGWFSWSLHITVAMTTVSLKVTDLMAGVGFSREASTIYPALWRLWVRDLSSCVVCIPRALSLRVMRPEREADYTVPSSAEVYNAWSFTFVALCLGSGSTLPFARIVNMEA
jgi:hypothetical protein